MMRSFRQDGARPCKALQVSSSTLKSDLEVIGSQCKDYHAKIKKIHLWVNIKQFPYSYRSTHIGIQYTVISQDNKHSGASGVHQLTCVVHSLHVRLHLLCTKPVCSNTLYQRNVDWFVKWCDKNALILNSVKTEEIIFGKPPTCPLHKVKIHNVEINQVSKYLGVMMMRTSHGCSF